MMDMILTWGPIILWAFACLCWWRVAALRQKQIYLLNEHIDLIYEEKKLDRKLKECVKEMKFLKFAYCIIPTSRIVNVQFDPNDDTMDHYTINLHLIEDDDDLQENFYFSRDELNDQEQVRAKEDALKRFYDILERLNGG